MVEHYVEFSTYTCNTYILHTTFVIYILDLIYPLQTRLNYVLKVAVNSRDDMSSARGTYKLLGRRLLVTNILSSHAYKMLLCWFNFVLHVGDMCNHLHVVSPGNFAIAKAKCCTRLVANHHAY